MRFSLKIFICAVLVVAVAFAAGGALLIDSNFKESKEGEVSRSLEEFLSLRFMLESSIISEKLQGGAPTGEALARIGESISENIRLSQGKRYIEVCDSDGKLVYSGAGNLQPTDKSLPALTAGRIDYHIDRFDSGYAVTVSGLFAYDGTPLYLTYIRDINSVFANLNAQLNAFMIYDAAIVLASAAALFLLALLLTRPVRKLTAASRSIASGETGVRADTRSSDEVGELAESFNMMAGAVEEKIGELERASRRKDEFIANFTHELKTPMTSIIGYADMLRSRECDAETVFKASSFIFSEGRRLESLSLKMLDLLMLEKHEFALRPMDCAKLLDYVSESMAPVFAQSGVTLKADARKGVVLAEPDLIKTLLINIADNARKASPPGSSVELCGRASDTSYEISVTDHGRGIPENELGKITEAFYMVDKARSRAQHGAGLGLAIASRIAELHGTSLNIRSIVDLGTCVSIGLKLRVKEVREAEDEE
jgi:signal transduction histidine kinase